MLPNHYVVLREQKENTVSNGGMLEKVLKGSQQRALGCP
jgi:hypothetical protein